jgi:hypothetical protein
MAAILSPLVLYEGNQKSKITLLANYGYMPLEGEFGNLCHRSIGRMPSDHILLSLDASLAIPTHVLRFEVSGLRHRTPVRPVLLTDQTGLELLLLRLPFFGLGFVDQPRSPVVF